MGNSKRSGIRRLAAATVLVGGLAVAGPAAAQTSTYVGVKPPQVGKADTSARPAAAPRTLRAQSTSRLAVTGGDILEMVGLGAASIGLGAVGVRAARRRSSSDPADDGVVATP